MSRWFRHYAGMVRDDKLVRVALKSKQSIERVVWIWGAVLESAAEIDSDARYEVDADEIAHFLRCKPAAVNAVLEALQDLGRIDGSTVTTWAKRQFKSDRSNARVAAHREKKRGSGNDDETLHVTGDVTLQERHCNSPETETETETDIPLSNDNGRPPLDEDAQFWADAKAYLTRRGVKNPGAMVGKWCRDHGRTETASIITRAQLERPADLIPFIEGSFRRQSNNGYGPGHSGVPL